MSKKHLSRSPKHITPNMWYYEENGGLLIYNSKGFIGRISSTAIRAYIKRKDKK